MSHLLLHDDKSPLGVSWPYPRTPPCTFPSPPWSASSSSWGHPRGCCLALLSCCTDGSWHWTGDYDGDMVTTNGDLCTGVYCCTGTCPITLSCAQPWYTGNGTICGHRGTSDTCYLLMDIVICTIITTQFGSQKTEKHQVLTIQHSLKLIWIIDLWPKTCEGILTSVACRGDMSTSPILHYTVHHCTVLHHIILMCQSRTLL